MQIAAFLAPGNVIVDAPWTEKFHALREMSRHAAEKLSLDTDAIAVALSQREALGSTGIGDGVAIPHARLPSLGRPFGVLARLSKPLDFAAIDERPVDIVFMLLLDENQTQAQLGALAAAARLLRSPETIGRLRRATGAIEFFSVAAG